MICEKCGNNCLDTQRFCNKCGAQLPLAADTPAADTPIPTVDAPVQKTSARRRDPLSMLTYLEPQENGNPNPGIGKWLCVLLLSFLPLFVTYLFVLINGIGGFDGIITSGGSSALAIILLAVIAAALGVQIAFLVKWAFGKKSSDAIRNYSLAFIIIAVAVTAILALIDVGMQTFANTSAFEFIASYIFPIGFVYALFHLI